MKKLENLTVKNVRLELLNAKVAKESEDRFLSLIYKIDRGIVAPLPIWEKIRDLIDPRWEENRRLLQAMDRLTYPIKELNKTLNILVILYRMLCPGQDPIIWVRGRIEQFAINGEHLFSIEESPNGGIPVYIEDSSYYYPIAMGALDEINYRRYYYKGGKLPYYTSFFGRGDDKEYTTLLWLKENHINSLMLDYWYKLALDYIR